AKLRLWLLALHPSSPTERYSSHLEKQQQRKMSIHIQFSNNSMRNTTASCDSLGIHYEITTTDDRVIHVHKWDKKSHVNVLVGEMKFYVFKKDEIRLPGDAEWRPMVDLYRKASSFFVMYVPHPNSPTTSSFR
ncbi:17241_t:CDS:2, partial [Acaulospora colombiana]